MNNIIREVNTIYQKNFPNITRFERALFLSWYCSKADCAFCYMSTQKDLIKDPKKARRSFASIFAEAIISKACGWEIEFLSGGYESFTTGELVFIAKTVSEITAKKQWLNIGTLKEEELKKFLPYIEGYVGTLECVNPEIRKKVCPSKPMQDIKNTFKACDKLNLKKAATVIIGLGESIADFNYLESFIRKNNLERITFYSLNPQQGTIYKESPKIEYYEQWIKKTRKAFPKLHITAGAWHDKISYYPRLLKAGSDNFTKFPAIKLFNSRQASEIEAGIKIAGKQLMGTFTVTPKINIDSELNRLDIEDSLKSEIKKRVMQYLKKMKK